MKPEDWRHDMEGLEFFCPESLERKMDEWLSEVYDPMCSCYSGCHRCIKPAHHQQARIYRAWVDAGEPDGWLFNGTLLWHTLTDKTLYLGPKAVRFDGRGKWYTASLDTRERLARQLFEEIH